MQVRIELELKRNLWRFDLPRIGQPRRADPRREHKAVRAVCLEVAGNDGEAHAPGPGFPRRILLECRTLGAEQPVRPFQVRRSDAMAPVLEKRHLV